MKERIRVGDNRQSGGPSDESTSRCPTSHVEKDEANCQSHAAKREPICSDINRKVRAGAKMDIVITEDSCETAPSRRMTHHARPETRTRGTIREIRMSGGTRDDPHVCRVRQQLSQQPPQSATRIIGSRARHKI